MGKNDNDPESPSADNVVMMPDGFGSSFSDKAIRRQFIRKVYGILLSQLALTTFIVGIIVFVPAVKGLYCVYTLEGDTFAVPHCTVMKSSGMAIYGVSYVVFFVTYITIVCCNVVRRKSPGNIICLFVFTIALSLMAGSIAAYHDAWWVMMAMGITTALCLGLTLFSFQTKFDITGWGMYLFAAVWVLFIFGIIAVIFASTGNRILYLVYSGLMALLFSMFLVYDTQMIMGGKKHEISPEEHIYGAIQLYVDVVYIFLAILSFGRR
jgi:FtsH-binding integral membrane protein